MQIMTEVSRGYMIESLTAPMYATHYWTLNGPMMDFKLEEIEYLEETTGPTISFKIHNSEITLPVSWNVLAVDRETCTIDSVPLTACITFEHEILLFSPHDCKLETAQMQLLEFAEHQSCFHPMIQKGTAMVHPTSLDNKLGKQVLYGIVCGPTDLNKFISGKTVGDILG